MHDQIQELVDQLWFELGILLPPTSEAMAQGCREILARGIRAAMAVARQQVGQEWEDIAEILLEITQKDYNQAQSIQYRWFYAGKQSVLNHMHQMAHEDATP